MSNFVCMNWTTQNTPPADALKAYCRPSLNDLTALSDAQRAAIQSQLDRKVTSWVTFHDADGITAACVVDADASTAAGRHKFRQAGADLGKLAAELKVDALHIDAGDQADIVTEGCALNTYRYQALLGKNAADAWSLKSLNVVGASEGLAGLLTAVHETRDLVNAPVLTLNAPGLAKRVEALGQTHGFSVEVLGKSQIEALKMGGLLGVNAGSIDPPQFIIMEHKPAGANQEQPIVLVGKGVVYDTGGLSLKPTAAMDDMKCDMAGSAAVIGTITALAANQVPLHVIGLVPATDNRPGGNATTPGDVITMMSGHTVEVMNTDAEGRLILADALHYAKRYNPELVIDLATLTGAAARAIGKQAMVAMGTDDQALRDLTDSGAQVHERVAVFPFWDDYSELLKSEIADMKNIGGMEAGAITAGKFLEKFTDYPYVHLDIAGPAFLDAPWTYYGKGATAAGVRLLYHYLTQRV